MQKIDHNKIYYSANTRLGQIIQIGDSHK